MDTTIDIVTSYLKKEGNASYNDIFDNLKKNKISEWEAYAEQNHMLLSELEIKKHGELYKILTLSGQFIRISSLEWGYESNHKDKK